MVLFPSEIRKIEIQFFGGRELPAQRIKIPMIAGGNHTSTNNDPPLQPVIDECTEQLAKLEFDWGSHEPSGTQRCNDLLRTLHELAAGPARQAN